MSNARIFRYFKTSPEIVVTIRRGFRLPTSSFRADIYATGDIVEAR